MNTLLSSRQRLLALALAAVLLTACASAPEPNRVSRLKKISSVISNRKPISNRSPI